MSEMKDVDECLPSIGVLVFVHSITGGMSIGMLVHEDFKGRFLKWVVNGALCFDVTHWQAIDYPELPNTDCKESKREKCIGCLRFYCDTDASIPYCHGLLALEGKCRFGGIFPEMAKGKQKRKCAGCALWACCGGAPARNAGVCEFLEVMTNENFWCICWEQKPESPQDDREISGPFAIKKTGNYWQIVHTGSDSPYLNTSKSVSQAWRDWLNELWKKKKARQDGQFDRVVLVGVQHFRFDLDPLAVFPVCGATSHPAEFVKWLNEMMNR